MTKKPNPAKQYQSYEVITQKDVETGDLLIPFPPQVLKELGWQVGDELDIQIDDKGKIYLKKLKK